MRNFADPEVGYVTGEARYLVDRPGGGRRRRARVLGLRDARSSASRPQLGSMVGGDGAIYAIRRPLWQTLPEDAINDFLNPLQIVEAGWRGVYEPEADLLRGDERRVQVGVPAPRPHRQPQLARGVPGARRAQPVPRRPLQLVPDLAQGAALVLRARSRRWRVVAALTLIVESIVRWPRAGARRRRWRRGRSRR